MKIKNKKIFSSWSGGKDSCLALYRSIKASGRPALLLTMLTNSGQRSRSHGLHPEIIKAQAASLAIPLMTGSASWDNYEEVFLDGLAKIKEQEIEYGIFGDIDLEPHRAWVERVCAAKGIIPLLPLWQEARRTLLNEFLETGFTAKIVAVKNERLDHSFLGRILDQPTINDLEQAGVDACGEEGEFHTVVTNGPIFSQEIILQEGEIITHDGYSFLDLSLIG
ncbi:MAG: diphthine--ammonia ligase [Proteobacteria bacterium]|nr:diphthine--ammonia ligase [Pseudomonadota bacterium]MBU1715267.1 diphthine--ammonia ligase [Pseudomonadota bacterium]